MKKNITLAIPLSIGLFLCAMLLFAAASALPVKANGGPGVPDSSGAVLSYGTVTLNNATKTLTTTTAKPSGADSWLGYSSGEYFVTFAPAIVTTTVYLTPQVSADSVNWVNLTYSYLTSTTVLTGQYAQSITGSGTAMFRLPSVGVYTRMLMTLSQNDTTTMTVILVKKNGGN